LDRFEQIASFLCVVTVEEEAELSQHHLKEILPFQEHVKGKCLEFISHYNGYQLMTEWSKVRHVHTSDRISGTS